MSQFRHSIFLPLLFLSLVLAACDESYELDPDQILYCKASSFEGYIVPQGNDNHGTLYIDDGRIVAVPHDVTLTTRMGNIYVEGEGVSRAECQLLPYENPAQQDIPEGVDYCERRYRVKEIRDVVYAHADGYWASYPDDVTKTYAEILAEMPGQMLTRSELPLDMDIYEPDDDGVRRRPLLVMVHAGAFFNGDKADEEYPLWCRRFASCGYTAISVNYRLGFVPYPLAVERAAYRAVQDVNAAIRYMLAHQELYRVDPNRIYVAGCSAGAIAALHVAFMTDDNRPESTRKQLLHVEMGPPDAIAVDPAYDEPFTVRAVGNMWGAMLNLDMMRSPRTPILSIHAEDDPVVPYSEGHPFHDAMVDIVNHWPFGMGKFLREPVGNLVDKLIPEVYGSGSMQQYACERGLELRLVSVPEHRHVLVRDENKRLNARVDEYFVNLSQFFQSVMVDHPVLLAQSSSGKQRCYIVDGTDVAYCSWEVEGGLITSRAGEYGVRVLLFADQSHHRLTVHGLYHNDLVFEEHKVFD